MLALALLLVAAAPAPHHPAQHPSPRPVAKSALVTTASGIRIKTLKAGAGPMPGPEDAVRIDYVGRLANGHVFDRAKGAGMRVAGTVPGFAEALQLMRKGGTYRIWIPPQLAYGAEGAGDGAVPPGATLDFTVTLLDIGHPAAPPTQ
ncbi:MAG: FKBP-type peptidyl-prolyl cis-trans isomerase [Allosphingosinicella sp.]